MAVKITVSEPRVGNIALWVDKKDGEIIAVENGDFQKATVLRDADPDSIATLFDVVDRNIEDYEPFRGSITIRSY